MAGPAAALASVVSALNASLRSVAANTVAIAETERQAGK
jgi:hypothetical protein